MPKAKKLHSKGKPIAIQKNCKLEEDGNETNTKESIREFELQLCWCINQLERTLAAKKGTEKQLQEAWKTVTILKSNNQPLIRKRQLMRTTFGDYRALMAAEEKQLTKMASKMKISDTTTKPKATFLRKSALLTNGDTSFKFNFDIQENESTKKEDENNGTLPLGDQKEEDTTTSGDTVAKKVEVKPTNINFTSSSSEFKFNFLIDNNY